MNGVLSGPIWSRKALVAFAALLAIVATALVITHGQETVSGADDGSGSEFQVVGDGSLPTKKPKLGAVRDALSAEETGYAIHLAQTKVPTTATDVTGKPGPEVLTTDLPLEAGDTRQAAVALYDYSSDTLYNALVNLTAGTVTVTSSTGRQPAPSNTEGDAAMALAIADGSLGFSEEFEQVEGVPLVDSTQVNYVAGAFNFDGTTTKGEQCGKDRCVQLFAETASGVWLQTFDFVVDLSTKSIVKLK